jgi:hypothetical protein
MSRNRKVSFAARCAPICAISRSKRLRPMMKTLEQTQLTAEHTTKQIEQLSAQKAAEELCATSCIQLHKCLAKRSCGSLSIHFARTKKVVQQASFENEEQVPTSTVFRK